MALEIVWTVRAAQGFDRIVKHLEEQWTEKEVKNFVKEAYDFFELLKEYPRILQMSTERKNVHRGPINKHTMLTYRVKPRKKEIELLNIRSTRQKPLKK
jgi:plasmid stabilization system protein ParE